jgi:putative glutamine amidotransferase
MTRPWIGIPTRFLDSGQTPKNLRPYLEAILWAGGLPVMIPVFVPTEVAVEYAQRLDAILLPGSPTDLAPALYGESPHPQLGQLFPERDALDLALLAHAEKDRLPVLGICFGAQSLNVYREGKLVQDIPSQIDQPLFHDDHGEPQEPARHPVRLTPGSRVATVAGAEAVEVNSFHHQAIAVPGRELRVTATAPDGVIEAVEDTAGRFIVGVQWHPERGFREDAFSQALFTAFVREAQKSQSQRHPV